MVLSSTPSSRIQNFRVDPVNNKGSPDEKPVKTITNILELTNNRPKSCTQRLEDVRMYLIL